MKGCGIIGTTERSEHDKRSPCSLFHPLNEALDAGEGNVGHVVFEPTQDAHTHMHACTLYRINKKGFIHGYKYFPVYYIYQDTA